MVQLVFGFRPLLRSGIGLRLSSPVLLNISKRIQNMIWKWTKAGLAEVRRLNIWLDNSWPPKGQAISQTDAIYRWRSTPLGGQTSIYRQLRDRFPLGSGGPEIALFYLDFMLKRWFRQFSVDSVAVYSEKRAFLGGFLAILYCKLHVFYFIRPDSFPIGFLQRSFSISALQQQRIPKPNQRETRPSSINNQQTPGRARWLISFGSRAAYCS